LNPEAKRVESEKKIRVLTDEVSEPADKLWSNCLRVGNVVYVSGLTSRGGDGITIEGGDEYQQARIIFGKIKAYIETAGGRMDDIVKMTIFVTRMSQNREVWRARREFFSGDFPTCALVEVSALATPDILVEINATAHLDCS
jgi:enamine deaminase RidA (YjgF/YER057c/UK114 family)